MVVLSVFAGCSSKEGLSGVYPCEGTVTYNGAPVENATVTFYPDGSGGDARTAGGSTDAGGKFKTTTLKPQDGLFPGNYKVTITKREEYGPPGKTHVNEEGETVQDGRPTKNVLPEKYEKVETSGLTATIEKKKNAVTFDLVD